WGGEPVTVALGEHGCLEVRLTEGACVVHRLGELERALDVLTGGLVVALAAVAAGAPREDVEAKLVGRKTRALGQHEGLVEEADGGRDAPEHVEAAHEPGEDLA